MPTSVTKVTPYAALQARVRQRPAQPLVTFYDLATGERMELSAATLDNAVAKVAGLLRDELDVLPGDRIGVHLPLHWQRAAWWGACAATGATFVADGAPDEVEVCVVDHDHLSLAGLARDDVLVSLEPFGLPSREPVPPGVVDAAVAARAHPDVFVPYVEPPDDGTMQEAQQLIDARELTAGSPVLVLDDDPDRDLLMLAVPLALDGSSVLVRNPNAGDLAAVVRAEGLADGR